MSFKIKEFRNKKGLTQQECVKSFNKFLESNNVKGITTATFSRWENSLNSPTDKMWNLLSKYFGVSVPYLKGKILSRSQIEDRLIPKIHQCYFDTWCFMHKKGNKKIYHDYSPKFVDYVDSYLVMSKDGIKLPPKIYLANEKNFGLSEKAKKYWKDNFDELFEEISEKDVSSDINTYFLFNEFKDLLKKKRDKLAHSVDNNVTSLGFFYKNEYDNEDFSESRMHDNMRMMLMRADYKTAKKAINEYAELIEKLKKDVNNFNENDYFMYRLDNIVMPIQNPFNANLIMNEVYKRVHDGNLDLLHYIMANDGLSLIDVYYNYKKSKNEDTDYLYELQKKDKQRSKLLSDDGFNSYLSNNYDFSTPDKIYDIEAIYKKYKNELKSKKHPLNRDA